MRANKANNKIVLGLVIFYLSFTSTPKLYSQQIIEDIGHYTQIGLPITALGVAVIKGDTSGVIQLATSVAIESAFVYGLKNLIDRQRPNGGGLSFPSGHTALSFTASTFLFKRYGWKYGVPATLLASFVGYSRFGTEKPVHFFTDVLAGAAVGIATSLIFTKKKIDPGKVSLSGGWSSNHFLVGVKITI